MKSIFALALVLLVVNATMVVEKRIVTKNVIQQLAKSRFGKNVFTAIQLELSSNSSENIVNRILELLHELDSTLRGQYEQTEDALVQKKDYCDNELNGLNEQAQSKQEKVNALEVDIPSLNVQVQDKDTELLTQKEAQAQAERSLQELEEQSKLERQVYEAQVEHNNSMIEALKEARRLISQLLRGFFLQKSENVLAQIKEHHASAVQKLNASNKSIFNVLMSMATNVDILAEQSKVTTVISIIDDLLEHQKETLEFLEKSEEKRLGEVSEKKGNFESQKEAAHSNILRLNSDLSVLSSQLGQAKNDLEVLKEDLKILKERIDSTFNACTDSIESYKREISNIVEETDVVKKVIEIFEGNSIQDIKSVVENMNYSE